MIANMQVKVKYTEWYFTLKFIIISFIFVFLSYSPLYLTM